MATFYVYEAVVSVDYYRSEIEAETADKAEEKFLGGDGGDSYELNSGNGVLSCGHVVLDRCDDGDGIDRAFGQVEELI